MGCLFPWAAKMLQGGRLLQLSRAKLCGASTDCKYQLTGLAYQLVIISMATDPEPQNALRRTYTKRAVIEASADRPKAPDFFEMQRRVVQISL